MRKAPRGAVALSGLVGLASVAALGVAGWTFTTGASVCSLLGACPSGVEADAAQEVALASYAPKGEAANAEPAAEAAQCAACAEAANGVCAACAAKTAEANAVAAAALEPVAKAKPKAAAAVVNATCPGSGMPVKESVTATFAGFTVGFCCENCQAKFNASEPAKRAATVAAMLVDKPVNAACPGSGMPIDAAHTVKVAGTTVGFCCGDCKAAFAAKPVEKQVAYIAAQVGAETINDVCASCNMPVSAEAGQVIFAGQRIGFGCAGCKPAFEAKSQAEKVAYLAKILEAREAKLAQTACTDATCTKDAPCAACQAKMEAAQQQAKKADATDAE